MLEITEVSGDYGEYGESVEGSFIEVGLRHDGRRTSVKSSPSATLDQRVLWIREKVMKFLALGTEYKLFNDLINDNNRYYEDKLLNFLNTDTYEVTDLEYKQVFFYKTYRDEIVQEEVSIWEEGRVKITAMGSFAAQVKSQRLVKSAPDGKR